MLTFIDPAAIPLPLLIYLLEENHERKTYHSGHFAYLILS